MQRVLLTAIAMTLLIGVARPSDVAADPCEQSDSLGSLVGQLGSSFVGNVTFVRPGSGPALAGVTEIVGRVMIGSNGSLADADLQALRGVRRIDGDLIVYGTLNIKTLEALSELEEVTGSVRMVDNSLEEVRLTSLRRVGADLEIRGTGPAFTSLNGLDALASVESLSMVGNKGLASVNALRGLRVAGKVTVMKNGWLPRSEEDQLRDSLRRAGSPGDIYIGYNGWWARGEARLPTFDVAVPAGGRTLNGDVVIRTRQDAEALRGVANLEGSLFIRNTSLTAADLDALRSLRRVGGLIDINSNTALDSLSFLDRLELVGGYFLIAGNARLPDLSGLSRLRGVRTELRIIDNGIERIGGLDALVQVGDGITIFGNANLQTIDGFGAITQLGAVPEGSHPSSDGALEISQNPRLAEIDGFNGLETVGQLVVSSNGRLVSIAGLSSLKQTGWALSIWGNGRLSDLSGLASLEFVGTNGRVASWSALEIRGFGIRDLSALRSLRRVAAPIRIDDSNPDAAGFRARYETTSLWGTPWR